MLRLKDGVFRKSEKGGYILKICFV